MLLTQIIMMIKETKKTIRQRYKIKIDPEPPDFKKLKKTTQYIISTEMKTDGRRR